MSRWTLWRRRSRAVARRVTLDTIDARLANIDGDLRWLDAEDRHGSLLCLERICRDVCDGYAQRAAMRIVLKTEQLSLTMAYVDMAVGT